MQVKISIDPGIWGFGAAVWLRRYWKLKVSIPIETYCIDVKPKNRTRVVSKTDVLAKVQQILLLWFDKYDVEDMFVEKPLKRQVAIKESLDIEVMRGVIRGVTLPCQCNWHDVEVAHWKGQLPKDLVAERIATLYGLHDLDICKYLTRNYLHDWDAVGIGLYEQGFFK